MGAFNKNQSVIHADASIKQLREHCIAMKRNGRVQQQRKFGPIVNCNQLSQDTALKQKTEY
jgi:hypothetical protein